MTFSPLKNCFISHISSFFCGGGEAYFCEELNIYKDRPVTINFCPIFARDLTEEKKRHPSFFQNKKNVHYLCCAVTSIICFFSWAHWQTQVLALICWNSFSSLSLFANKTRTCRNSPRPGLFISVTSQRRCHLKYMLTPPKNTSKVQALRCLAF